MTNIEVATILRILGGLKVCVPGSIDPGITDKLIDLTCDVQDAYERVMKKAEIIREQTRPDGVASWAEATDEQRASWEASMKEPLRMLDDKETDVTFEPLTRDEFRQLTAANTLTGAQASVLRRLIVEQRKDG